MANALTSKTIVWVGLAADAVVAAVKIAAALFTGSASTAAEGVHSVVDVSSGGLMLFSERLHGGRSGGPGRPRVHDRRRRAGP